MKEFEIKRIGLTITILFSFFISVAQDTQSFEAYKNKMQNEMAHYRDSLVNDYEAFRQKANAEYARFMKDRWEAFGVTKARPVPEIPEPINPVHYRKDDDLSSTKLPLKTITKLPQPKENPLKPADRPPVTLPQNLQKEHSFLYHNTPCVVRIENGMNVKIESLTENDIANAWEKMASADNGLLLSDCLNLRAKMNLCDWAYISMLKSLASSFYGGKCNEAVLLQTYLLAQSGYALRIANNGKILVLCMPFDGDIYGMRSVGIGGKWYYLLNDGKESGSIKVFDRAFSNNEKTASLRMNGLPKLKVELASSKIFTSERYPKLSFPIAVNRNMIAFLDTYPRCTWENYVWAGLSDDLKNALYPMLRKNIEGVGQIEAANRIINFVQTALDYKTDGQQFGGERSLFGDESFFYPYSDCEDRAILFSIIVRDLLNLDVVLLQYPRHIATAVCFTEYAEGDYFNIDGKQYTICDPTYIGASIGMCMPDFKSVGAKIHKL